MTRYRNHEPDLQSLSQAMRDHLQQIKRDDEKLLWVEHPQVRDPAIRRAVAVCLGVPLILFGIIFLIGTIEIFCDPEEAKKGLKTFLVVIDMLLWSSGIWCLSMPRRGRINAGKSTYVLTDKRVILIMQKKKKLHVRTKLVKSLVDVERKVRSDGSGHLLFGPARMMSQTYQRLIEQFAFRNVRDVALVNDLINQAISDHYEKQPTQTQDAPTRSNSIPSIDPNTLEPALRKELDQELAEGENTIWIGQPIGKYQMLRFVHIFIFGLVFAAIPLTISLFFAFDGIGPEHADHAFDKAMSIMPIFMALPFTCVGLGIAGVPFWHFFAARKTLYVMTNQRVILFKPQWQSRAVVKYQWEQLNELDCLQRPDGSGDLVLGRTFSKDSDGHTVASEHGFMSIPNFRDVLRMVNDHMFDVK